MHNRLNESCCFTEAFKTDTHSHAGMNEQAHPYKKFFFVQIDLEENTHKVELALIMGSLHSLTCSLHFPLRPINLSSLEYNNATIAHS